MPKVTIGGMLVNLDSTPSVDNKYGPYLSLTAAFEYLYNNEYNVVGLTVGIIQDNGSIKEYWFKDAAEAVTDLVVKAVDDAPVDNKEYVRKNGTWVENAPGVTDFDSLVNRPKYNGITMTSATDVVVPEIEDSLTSESVIKTLSAKQGKVLQDEILALQQRGRYLSTWNATIGLPTTTPTALPYNYKTGDYYIVSLVGTVNYKPDGKQYTGSASTVVESNKVSVNDTYYFDGTNWSLLHVEGGGVNWIIDPAVPTEPSWDSPLAPAAAIWGDPSSAILDWK